MISLGLTDSEIISFQYLNLSVAQIIEWASEKVSPDDVDKLLQIGCDIDELRKYNKMGLTIEDIEKMKELDIDPIQYSKLKKQGISPDDMKAAVENKENIEKFKKLKLNMCEIKKLQDLEISSDDFEECLKLGLKFEDVLFAKKNNISPTDYAKMKEMGLNNVDIARTTEIGISPELYIKMKNMGLTPHEMEKIIEADITPEDYVKLKKMRITDIENLKKYKQLGITPEEFQRQAVPIDQSVEQIIIEQIPEGSIDNVHAENVPSTKDTKENTSAESTSKQVADTLTEPAADVIVEPISESSPEIKSVQENTSETKKKTEQSIDKEKNSITVIKSSSEKLLRDIKINSNEKQPDLIEMSAEKSIETAQPTINGELSQDELTDTKDISDKKSNLSLGAPQKKQPVQIKINPMKKQKAQKPKEKKIIGKDKTKKQKTDKQKSTKLVKHDMAVVKSSTGSANSLIKLLTSAFKIVERVLILDSLNGKPRVSFFSQHKLPMQFYLYEGCVCNMEIMRRVEVPKIASQMLSFLNIEEMVQHIIGHSDVIELSAVNPILYAGPTPYAGSASPNYTPHSPYGNRSVPQYTGQTAALINTPYANQTEYTLKSGVTSNTNIMDYAQQMWQNTMETINCEFDNVMHEFQMAKEKIVD